MRRIFKMNSFIILFLLGTVTIELLILGTSSLSIDDSVQSLEDGELLNNTFAIQSLAQLDKTKEIELQKANKVNKNFERLIQLVNILGQVDTFLSERTKSMMRKLALLAQDDDGYSRRRRS